MRRLIRGGRIIDPSQKLDCVGHVVIEEERVAAILRPEQPAPQEAEVIPAEGMWVCPGLIDMHVHLRQPGFEYKEDVGSGSRAAAAGGFTAIACMANTEPINDTASVSQLIMEAADRDAIVKVKVVAAATKGQKGEELTEYGDLAELGVVGVSDDGSPIAPARTLRRVLEYASNFGLAVLDHPEEKTLSAKGHMNEGAVSTRLGLNGIPAASEEIGVHRDIAVCRLTGLPIHLQHISTAGSVDLIRRAKAQGLPVTAETAPHYFTLTEESVNGFDVNCKMNPPLRTADDVAAIKAALADGTLDCIATDHAPHAPIEKEVEFMSAPNGIVGLETSLALSLSLVREKTISPGRMIELMSLNPAKVLGLRGGSLKPGRPADLTIIDPEFKTTVDPDKFQSKARNTAFAGWAVQGRAVMTIIDGKTAFRV